MIVGATIRLLLVTALAWYNIKLRFVETLILVKLVERSPLPELSYH
jgi:hypothetical protein